MKYAITIFFCWIVMIESYNMQKLTVLTGPIGTQSSAQYLGHSGVTRSLITGLKKIGASFSYNPRSVSDVGDVVYIVAGDTDVIEQVLTLKKQGIVKKILAGPNAFDLFKPGNPYAQNKLIDLRVNPSEWIRNAHLLRYPDLNEVDFLVWAAGIDEQSFKPIRFNDYSSKKVLVYNKYQDELTNQVTQLLRQYNFEPVVISYGSYTPQRYKQVLSDVSFAVFLTKTESQCLALAECWAMEVPTLCWNLECPHHYLGIDYPVSSACPYLTSQTGMQWKTLNELTNLLEYGIDLFASCLPRAWVLEHMTDEIVVKKLLAVIAKLPGAES